jgi:hypothetical protein
LVKRHRALPPNDQVQFGLERVLALTLHAKLILDSKALPHFIRPLSSPTLFKPPWFLESPSYQPAAASSSSSLSSFLPSSFPNSIVLLRHILLHRSATVTICIHTCTKTLFRAYVCTKYIPTSVFLVYLDTHNWDIHYTHIHIECTCTGGTFSRIPTREPPSTTRDSLARYSVRSSFAATSTHKRDKTRDIFADKHPGRPAGVG